MQLWKAGDVTKVDGFINQAALGRDPLFAKVVPAVIELAGTRAATTKRSCSRR